MKLEYISSTIYLFRHFIPLNKAADFYLYIMYNVLTF